MIRFKKLACVLLAMVMIFGSVSVAASAAYTPYLDSAITGQYNTIDRAELNLNQKSSLLLDMLDVMLQKEDIVIDIPIIGTIDLTSTDKALNSIYSLTGNFLFGNLTVGEVNNRILGITPESGNIQNFVTPVSGYSVSCNNGASYIGTGSTITITDSLDNVVSTYTAVVYGDLNGDGAITSSDAETGYGYLEDMSTLISGTIEFAALDIDANGEVTSEEIDMLYATVG